MHMHTHIHTNRHTHTSVYTYTDTHIDTYAYTHTLKPAGSQTTHSTKHTAITPSLSFNLFSFPSQHDGSHTHTHSTK